MPLPVVRSAARVAAQCCVHAHNEVSALLRRHARFPSPHFVLDDLTVFSLKVDYDGQIPADFGARLTSVLCAFRVGFVWCVFRRTARGYHCHCRLKGRATASAIVAAQAILGSDWRREGFNLGRVRGLRNGTPQARELFNVLYTRKITVPNYHGG